ncbi:MAG: sodium:solute symporter family protein [Candidatus Methanomethylicia archaeon]
MEWWIPVAIILTYQVLSSIPGILAYKWFKPRELYDYMSGGKTIGLFAMALSIGATQWSALSFMGFIAFYYLHGVPGWNAMSLGYLLISVGCLYGIMGIRARELAEKYKYVTPSDFVNHFYKDRYLGILVGVMLTICLLPYMQIQLGGVGYILEVASGGRIPFIYGALLLYILIAIYTFLGGLKSIAWVDVAQGFLFLIVALGVGAYMWSLMGGISGINSLAITKPSLFTIPGGIGAMTALYMLSWTIPVQMGWPIQPQIFMRLASIKRKEHIYYIPALMIVAVTGLYFMQQYLTWIAGWIVTPGFKEPDKLLITIAYKNWDPILFGILGAAGVAAMTTSVNSQAHACASVFVNDVLVKIRKFDEKIALLIVRVAMLVVLFIGLCLWFVWPWLLMTLGALSSSIGSLCAVALLPSLFNIRFVTRYGASLGIISGFIVLVYTEFINKYPYGIYSGGWGLLTAVIVCIIVSLLTQKYKPAPLEK